jgi:hypothetical protein
MADCDEGAADGSDFSSPVSAFRLIDSITVLALDELLGLRRQYLDVVLGRARYP